MNKLMLVGVAVLALGCSKKRIAECDHVVETLDKMAKCEKLPPELKTAVVDAHKTMKDALQQLDDAGGAGNAPKETVDQLAKMCKTQEDAMVEQVSKIAPDCTK